MPGYKYVDTNVLIMIGEGKEEYIKWLQAKEEKDEKMMVASIVMAEVIWVLKSFYKKNREEINQFVDSIVATRCLQLRSKHNIKKALELYKQSGIKFTDCLIASYMKAEDVIYSDDLDFEKLGVKRREIRADQD